MSEIKLLPCPFCGKSAAVMSDVGDCEMCGNFESGECPEYRKPEKDGCMQIVVCDVGRGGCGASGGWRFGRETASRAVGVLRWGRRVKTMREILFRGKRVDNGKWVEGSMYRLAENLNPFIMLKNRCGESYEVDVDTAGQYTGFEDKNGKKIFEGDIVQNVTNGNTAIVEWFSEHSAFMLYCSSKSKVYWLYDNNFSIVEVVGNIYYTPELLEGGDSE